MELLSKDNYLGHTTVQFVGSLASQPELFKQGILSSYQKNEIDQELILRELEADRLERVMFATLESYRSIAHDFKGLVEFHWESVSKSEFTKKFVHGAADRIHDLDLLSELAKAIAQSDILLVPHVGQWTEGNSHRRLLDQKS